ncbi:MULTISPECIES: hypothetical protein [Bacillaceae]|uniref:YtkA-like domain-containing protein n=1 Tax=Domibacillus aminovorans TaxID=29332 RepID=A0A177KXU1_9BACI|nr:MULTISPECIES: hypothetical protein [Bacillaceae]OAH57956.1 hypothetical protein AWH48_02825 [Domibacillus aminovorans]
MPKKWIYFCTTSTILLTVGCSEDTANVQTNPTDQPISVAHSPSISVEDKKPNLQVNMNPQPAKILKENELRITWDDSMKKNPEAIIVNLSMPGMDHGDLVVEAEKKGDRAYVAKVVPVMVGTWVADIKIQTDGHITSIKHTFEAVR